MRKNFYEKFLNQRQAAITTATRRICLTLCLFLLPTQMVPKITLFSLAIPSIYTSKWMCGMRKSSLESLRHSFIDLLIRKNLLPLTTYARLINDNFFNSMENKHSIICFGFHISLGRLMVLFTHWSLFGLVDYYFASRLLFAWGQ